MIKYNPQLKIFYSNLLDNQHYFSGFATSNLGDGRKDNTIWSFFHESKYKIKQLVRLKQIHSTNIKVWEEKGNLNNSVVIENTDGVITKEKNAAFIAITADCVPIIFQDPFTGTIGISHQGWKGSLNRLTQKMVTELQKLGSKTENLRVAIGPAINQCCYDIDENRYKMFQTEFSHYSYKFLSTPNRKHFLNLIYLNYLQLIEAGVKKEHIDFFPFCTRCDSGRFFSSRRLKQDDFPRMFNFVLKFK